MIGKIIGAMAGASMAKNTRGGMKGPGGAILGAGAVAVARRFGPMGLVAGALGGYLLKRHNKKANRRAGHR
jgi:hypothetical protein